MSSKLFLNRLLISQISGDNGKIDAMICDPCLKELNGAFWLRVRARNAEESCFAKRREEFEAAQPKEEEEEPAAVPDPSSPRVKREDSVEIMEATANDQVKEEDNDVIMTDELEEESEETELEDNEQAKVATVSTKKDKLAKVTKKQVKDAFEKLNKKREEKKVAINQCPICNKSFTNNRIVRQHIESIHEKKTRFICPHCPKACYFKHHLQSHITHWHTFTNDTTSNSNRPFECEVDDCGKFYKTKIDLKIHQQRVHSSK
jgi:Zinc finger, C2H2 type